MSSPKDSKARGRPKKPAGVKAPPKARGRPKKLVVVE